MAKALAQMILTLFNCRYYTVNELFSKFTKTSSAMRYSPIITCVCTLVLLFATASIGYSYSGVVSAKASKQVYNPTNPDSVSAQTGTCTKHKSEEAHTKPKITKSTQTPNVKSESKGSASTTSKTVDEKPANTFSSFNFLYYLYYKFNLKELMGTHDFTETSGN